MAKANELFSRDEIAHFIERSNWAGARAMLVSWGMIAGTFALLARYPHPITYAAAVVILGGRQLGLAVLMHEAAHGTLFRNRFLNDVVTDWLCARPVFTDVPRYRKHHLGHHAHAGTEEDPDRGLVTPFPVTRASLRRKLLRDIVGISGVKRVLGLLLIDLDLLHYNVSGTTYRLPYRGVSHHTRAFLRNALPGILVNAIMLGVLAWRGHAWVYSAWIVAYLTTYGLFVRVRSMAEHACTAGGRDARYHTRTTYAGLLARLTVSPHSVGYHLEHHLLPTVPYFKLREMHLRLRERELIPEGAIARSYGEVLGIVSAR
jgi:fatty acid desaturase